MKTWIKNPLVVWTGNDQIADSLVIENDKVVELVEGQEPTQAYDETYDASGQVVIPGLINCHHHFYQTLTRALPAAANKELFPWLQSLYPVWANLDEEAIAASTELALTELLLSGCTTAADHHYVFSKDLTRAIDVQADVAKQLGMRVLLTRGSMSLGESAGGLPPDKVVQTEEEILKDSERLIGAIHNSDEGALVQLALAPCSPFSVTTELMKQTAVLAREKGVLLHTHLAETEDENDFCLEMFGMRPVDYLEEVNWLAGDAWLAHGIHFNETEIQRLGAAGTAVSHCPSSNMILASGIAPVKELNEAGVAVGLGVDGSASNDGSNMIQEVRQAFLIQRLRYGSANVSAEHALRWGTSGGAKLMHRNDIGEIAVGKQADLALFDLDQPRFSGQHDPLAALVVCGADHAEAVMVAGQWKVKDGQLVDGDLAEVMSKHRQAAQKLVNRA